MKTGYQVARLLAYVTGLVNQELVLQVEYLAAENRILRARVPARLRLSNEERSTLAEIGKRLGRKGLAKVAQVAKPETILGWFRKLVAQKFDGSKHRSCPGRPRIAAEVEALIVQMARENSGWGYDRIAGALANVGHEISESVFEKLTGVSGPQINDFTDTGAWQTFIRPISPMLHGRLSPRYCHPPVPVAGAVRLTYAPSSTQSFICCGPAASGACFPATSQHGAPSITTSEHGRTAACGPACNEGSMSRCEPKQAEPSVHRLSSWMVSR